MSEIDRLSREDLLKLARDFAKNWLAHDGLWFQEVERRYGIEEAMDADAAAWMRFSPIEAKRICDLLELGENSGLEGLQRALNCRMYALINGQHSELADGVLRFYMDQCRVQTARARKGLPAFPCKKVGLVEYESFAQAIDSRIRTRCIVCPPEQNSLGCACAWEFSI
jgi:hypothetical protein